MDMTLSTAVASLMDQPAASGLNTGDLEQFDRDGYVIVRQLARPEIWRRMLEVTRAGLQAGSGPVEYEADLHYPGAPDSRDTPGGDTIRRLREAQSRDPVFMQWISSAPVLTRLRQLLGPAVVMPLAHHNCVMTKQPRYSSQTGWHQDIRYWSYQRPELVSLWLALGRESPENGCLHLIPGTHRIPIARERLDEALFLRPDLPENAELLARRIPAPLEPGDALFFHCRIYHAAGRNETEQTKYSVVFTFRSQDNPPRSGSRSAATPELLLPPESEPPADERV